MMAALICVRNIAISSSPWHCRLHPLFDFFQKLFEARVRSLMRPSRIVEHQFCVQPCVRDGLVQAL